MDKKTFIISLIIIFVVLPVISMAAYATFRHNAIYVSDGKDVDLNGQSIGNGTLLNMGAASNYNDTYSYILYNDGTTTYAKNSSTGNIDYSSNSAIEVFTQALQNGSSLYIKDGNYSLTAPIYLNRTGQKISGESLTNTILYVNHNGKGIITGNSNEDIFHLGVEDISIIGNNITTGQIGIHLSGAPYHTAYSIFKNIYITNFNNGTTSTGIRADYAVANTFYNIRTEKNQRGVFLAGDTTTNTFYSLVSRINTYRAVGCLNSFGNRFYSPLIESNFGQYGAEFDGCEATLISSPWLENNNRNYVSSDGAQLLIAGSGYLVQSGIFDTTNNQTNIYGLSLSNSSIMNTIHDTTTRAIELDINSFNNTIDKTVIKTGTGLLNSGTNNIMNICKYANNTLYSCA